ncbi:MAG: ParA family protein [Thioalkalivibrionaceae bacterium]
MSQRLETLALYNLKGGVGKSTAAVQLAAFAANYGRRVLVWDLDAQAAATWMLGLEAGLDQKVRKLARGKRDWATSVLPTAWPRLSVLPADFEIRHLDRYLDEVDRPQVILAQTLADLGDRFDLVVFDCPPSLSTTAETLLRTVDVVAMPLIPAPLSLRTYQQIVGYLAEHRVRRLTLRPFLSMIDRRRRDHRDWGDQLRTRLPTAFRTEIPYAARIEASSRDRSPLAFGAAGRNQDAYADRAARAFESLWLEVAGALHAARIAA